MRIYIIILKCERVRLRHNKIWFKKQAIFLILFIYNIIKKIGTCESLYELKLIPYKALRVYGILIC